MKKIVIAVVCLFFCGASFSQPQDQGNQNGSKGISMKTFRLLNNAPKSADDVENLLDVARSTSAEIRKSYRTAALTMLGNPEPKAVSVLGARYLSLLDDSDSDIRSVAAVACGTLGYKEAIPKLRRNLKALPKHPFNPDEGLNFDEYRAAMGAATGLASLGDQEAVPEVLDRESLSPSWELLLPKFGAKALPQVVEKARSKRESVRNGALKSIAAFNDPDSLPQLKNILSDPDQNIRTAAVRGLVRMKSAEAMTTVRAAYMNLDDSGKSTVAMSCLELCDSPTAMQYVKDFMSKGKQGYSKTLVVMALGNSKKPEAVPYLEGLLKDADDGVREEAACQLARLTGKRYQYAETNWTRLGEKNCQYFKGLEK